MPRHINKRPARWWSDSKEIRRQIPVESHFHHLGHHEWLSAESGFTSKKHASFRVDSQAIFVGTETETAQSMSVRHTIYAAEPATDAERSATSDYVVPEKLQA